MKFLRTLAVYILLLPLVLLSLLPLCVHRVLARFVAWLLGDVLKYRLPVIRTNLRGAFPDLDEDGVRGLAKDYYGHLADIICETVWSLTRSYRHIRRKGVCSVENGQELERLFEKYGSVVVLLGHTGNWELLPGLPVYSDEATYGYDNVVSAYHTMSSPLSEELFLRLRSFHRFKRQNLVPSGSFLRYVLQHRDDRKVYFFIADQCPEGKGGVETEFLGLRTAWVTGAEAIARKTGMPVAYIGINRRGRGKYVISCSTICEDPAGTRPGDITGTYASMLERDIRNDRVNWLWSHRRWKNIWNYEKNKQ
ncbi:MAG: lysophospholipid acyltransferase family protein [Bacteroidales bacterium]|nr:lysophospholipid acyltransferase family protein [Bacteroidales bacterium]